MFSTWLFWLELLLSLAISISFASGYIKKLHDGNLVYEIP